jgi:hypothetical protein
MAFQNGRCEACCLKTGYSCGGAGHRHVLPPLSSGFRLLPSLSRQRVYEISSSLGMEVDPVDNRASTAPSHRLHRRRQRRLRSVRSDAPLTIPPVHHLSTPARALELCVRRSTILPATEASWAETAEAVATPIKLLRSWRRRAPLIRSRILARGVHLRQPVKLHHKIRRNISGPLISSTLTTYFAISGTPPSIASSTTASRFERFARQ